MYEGFYNLAMPPFHNTPNSRFFFETEQHREALAKLEYTVRNRRGFALVTGEIGSGKTTLIRTLMRRLPRLRLDDADNVSWRRTFTLRGLTELTRRIGDEVVALRRGCEEGFSLGAGRQLD